MVVTGIVAPRVQLVDRSGVVQAEAKVSLPADAQSGDLIETRSVLRPVQDMAEGDYAVRVVMDSATATLGSVRVKDRPHIYQLPGGVQTRAVRLGERIELAGYTLAPQMVSPGATARLTLYWRALDKSAASYKVFAHVIDAQGQLLAQQDGIPVHWTLPTAKWVKGEIIADEYDLPIPASAAPGKYTLYVGMYDAGNGQRLPAVENGQPVQNNAINLVAVEIER